MPASREQALQHFRLHLVAGEGDLDELPRHPRRRHRRPRRRGRDAAAPVGAALVAAAGGLCDVELDIGDLQVLE